MTHAGVNYNIIEQVTLGISLVCSVCDSLPMHVCTMPHGHFEYILSTCRYSWYLDTVDSPNNRHCGALASVLYSEYVLYWGVWLNHFPQLLFKLMFIIIE